MWLGSVDDLPHLLLFIHGQVNIARCPIFFKASCLRCSRNSNHSLRSDPSECDLADLTSPANSELFYCVHDFLVLVEVLALEFGGYGNRILAFVKPESRAATHNCGGSHQERSRRGNCNRNYRRAIRALEGCMQHMRRQAPWRSRSDCLFRAQSRRPSTRLGQHLSWQLPEVRVGSPTNSGSDLLELALRKVAAEHSESPICLVFPALRISSSAAIDSDRGVSRQVSYNQPHFIWITH